MDWEDQDDFEEQEEIEDPEHSFSHSLTEGRLQQCKDFKRPDVQLADFRQAQQSLYLMGIDITYTNKLAKDRQGRQVMRPVIKIYAINQKGNSFLVHVKDFVPYFYVPFPNGLTDTPANLEQFRQAINKLFKEREESKRSKEFLSKNPIPEESIILLEPVHRVNLYGYVPREREREKRYLKIHTATPNVVAPLRSLFEKEERISGINLPTKTFQSNIPFALRFMVDKGVTGMGWMKIKAGEYSLRECSRSMKDSSMQVEIECSESALQELKSEGEWARIAPLRVLSFDIECSAEHGFPSAERDPIIQIACVCKVLPTTEESEEYRIVIVLNGCSSISGVQVKEAENQIQLLTYFQQFLITYDPDFIIGYNIINFDLPYVLDRAEKLKMRGYGHFGRSSALSRIKKSTLQSKIMGNRETKDINIEGRIQLDIMIHMIREHKLSSYTLNNVSYHFLRDQKEDVHHSQIFKLFKESRETRKRLAIYCVKDSELPLKLLQKLCCLFNYTEMARVTGVPLNFLLNRGQQIKVVSQLLRKSKERFFILPTNRASRGNEDKGFEGAYVLSPKVGYYQQPIATLDFASLYPSIMMAHNLCYTTLVNANQIEQMGLDPEDVTKTPEGFYFVTNRKKRQGLLPQILQELLASRKKAKKQLANAKDQLMRNVLDGRQLALKISANSVYGFTGATVGQLPCLQISASVTSFGREMIQKTKNRVMQLYPGSDVIYGDTDSVMVKFKLPEQSDEAGSDEEDEGQVKGPGIRRRERHIKESMRVGKEAALKISLDFKSPIRLQFEKVYCPFLLMAKKRYVGVYYSKSHKVFDKIDKKGFESVRRDNCYLIRQILENILDLLLCKNNIPAIVTYVQDVISQLVKNQIDISKLVITKAISKKTEEEGEDGKPSGKGGKNTYRNKQPHVELAAKMQKRDKNIILNIGDRISYVMIEGTKGSKNYQNAEDPIRVLEEDVPIDYDYYIQKQIRPPLQRLLQSTGIILNIEALFTGQHTKNRYISKINQNNALSKFVTIQSTCINCPNRSEKPLCDRCSGKYLEIVVAKQLEMEGTKAHYQDLWGECQKCQGSVTMDILCSNADCPIYYKRIKVKKDLKDRMAHLQKMELMKKEELQRLQQY